MYFAINDIDFSKYVKALNISTINHYTAQTNAAGNTVVDFINQKRIIEVGFIPMLAADALKIRQQVSKFNVKIAFLNPDTNAAAMNVECIVPDNDISYLTIRNDKTMVNEFSLTFEEL